MDSPVFTLKNPWIASFLIPIFTFICGDFTVSIIITSLILGGSAFLFLQHSKHNVQVLVQEDESDQIDSNQAEIVENKGLLNMGSPDSSSESEVIDQFSCTTEEDSDFGSWRYSGEGRRRAECSDDGSISDEESLIEIELGGHYAGYNHKECKDEEETKFCRRQKSPDSVLWWPEMNEEENMIEIDLSVGSIKCSRIEIEA